MESFDSVLGRVKLEEYIERFFGSCPANLRM
jgi:hypothetical protein